jgi:hypothetical protein
MLQVYGHRRGNAPVDVGSSARHIKMHNEERERREKNLGSTSGRGLSADMHSAAVQLAVSNPRHHVSPKMPDTASASARQKQPNPPTNVRQQRMTFSDIDDVSASSLSVIWIDIHKNWMITTWRLLVAMFLS